ncbi:MAG: hypothetical protein GY940_01385, partial [bacterium]|nr:hypothetical protein [bacterium]
DEKIPELKERIGNFLVRNLRVNAQQFMKYKFTRRNCETLNFNMGDEEKTLYNNISNYFERDDIYAYSTNGLIDLKDSKTGGIRNLLKMCYRRALGSSFPARISILQSIQQRLEKMKNGEWEQVIKSTASDDWENDAEDLLAFDVEEEEVRIPYEPGPEDIRAIESEIIEVQSFINRAQTLKSTAKDKLLLKALENIFASPDRFNEKAVIFTTYI